MYDCKSMVYKVKVHLLSYPIYVLFFTKYTTFVIYFPIKCVPPPSMFSKKILMYFTKCMVSFKKIVLPFNAINVSWYRHSIFKIAYRQFTVVWNRVLVHSLM